MTKKATGSITAQYVWGNDLARCNGEYPLSDGRGNVRQSTNASQQITSANAPTAFGIGSVTGGTASAYSYGAGSGYRQDGIAPAGLPSSYALQKVGARYYDPAVGGFLTRDTDLSQSPYAYCDGDPVNRSDSNGHLSVVNIASGGIQVNEEQAGGAADPLNASESAKKAGEAVTKFGDELASAGVIGAGAGYFLGKQDPGDPINPLNKIAEGVNALSFAVGALGGTFHFLGEAIGGGFFDSHPGVGTNGIDVSGPAHNRFGQPFMQ